MQSAERFDHNVSVTLDLLRAAAAQAVCVGHAWNLFELGPLCSIGHKPARFERWGIAAKGEPGRAHRRREARSAPQGLRPPISGKPLQQRSLSGE
jgi:hypothetical protein